ncbi:hypothetical protein SHIRM173S_00398 [Streptomyces hirsutus]
MAWEPPRATGQPRACAARAKTRPMAPVAKPPRGAITWATSPANRALARSSWKRRISQVEGWSPTRPKRARPSGSRGSAVSGRDMKSRARVSHRGRKGWTRRRYAPASRGPKEAAVSPTDRDSTAAVPSRKGWAMGRSACSHSRPWRSSGRARKAGELMPSGWAAEHGSCRKPGRVSSSVRAPPPTVPLASNNATEKPRRASSTAAVSPFGPAPTTTTSSIDTTFGTPSSADGTRRQPGRSENPGYAGAATPSRPRATSAARLGG